MRVEALTSHDVLVEVPVTVTSEHALGRSFRCAIRGLREAWEGEPNFRFQVAAALTVALCGFLVRLSLREWTWIAVAAGFVLLGMNLLQGGSAAWLTAPNIPWAQKFIEWVAALPAVFK